MRFRETDRKRLDELDTARREAREHAIRAFQQARIQYHGALKARRKGWEERTRQLARDLDAAEDNCQRLGLDPWAPQYAGR